VLFFIEAVKQAHLCQRELPKIRLGTTQCGYISIFINLCRDFIDDGGVARCHGWFNLIFSAIVFSVLQCVLFAQIIVEVTKCGGILGILCCIFACNKFVRELREDGLIR
jgi:hypothetical protein